MKAKRWTVALGILAVALTLVGTTPAQAQQDPFVANHYLCYPIMSLETPFEPRVVLLRDQFSQYQVNVLRPVELCNPVSKNNGHIPEPQWHLVCYEFLLFVGPGAHRVKTGDQFGDLIFKVQVPNRLCLPATKVELPMIGTGGGMP